MDRIPTAHAGAVLSLDWAVLSSVSRPGGHSNRHGGPSAGAGLFDDILPSMNSGTNAGVTAPDADSAGEGWLVSGSLDRTVKV